VEQGTGSMATQEAGATILLVNHSTSSIAIEQETEQKLRKATIECIVV